MFLAGIKLAKKQGEKSSQKNLGLGQLLINLRTKEEILFYQYPACMIKRADEQILRGLG
jgi:hypothetical protein